MIKVPRLTGTDLVWDMWACPYCWCVIREQCPPCAHWAGFVREHDDIVALFDEHRLVRKVAV